MFSLKRTLTHFLKTGHFYFAQLGHYHVAVTSPLEVIFKKIFIPFFIGSGGF